MYLVEKTATFDRWLVKLKDAAARARILVRIKRMGRGNLGTVKPVGGKVYEAKIDCGPGYRLYYAIRHRTMIWLLCGGAKGTQKRDIEKAKQLLKELEIQDD
jgi:putative addiction module killer protein